jgi:S-adenosylmethionine:tRNA ribosyltransferase-isomerase
LKQAGISLVPLTLHVGYGTFQRVQTRDIREHRLDEEYYAIGPGVSDAVGRTKRCGGRVVAVGTTVVRALETAAEANGRIRAGSGRTRLLITPGHRFRVVDGLITNFHLPRSSLLFLVSAFLGLDRTREAYQWAVDREYRFYSYGDAMLIV